jgi:hypothetical protein
MKLVDTLCVQQILNVLLYIATTRFVTKTYSLIVDKAGERQLITT